jgi:hypothetical protein
MVGEAAIGSPFTYVEDLPWCIVVDPHTQRVIPSKETERQATGTGTPKQSHRRRSHWRTLRLDYYKEPGRKVLVKEAWVGPHEWEQGGQRYRVIR